MNLPFFALTVLILFAIPAAAQPPAITPAAPEFKIEPTFIDLSEMTFAGIATYAGPASPRFPELWTVGFQPVMKGAEADDGAAYGLETKKYCYGLELFPPEFEKDPKRNFTYLAGYSVTDSRKVPLHLLQRTVPTARFAVFRVPDGLKGLGETFGYIYSRWLPASGFDRAFPFDMERYDIQATAQNGGNLQIEILVPIVPRK